MANGQDEQSTNFRVQRVDASCHTALLDASRVARLTQTDAPSLPLRVARTLAKATLRMPLCGSHHADEEPPCDHYSYAPFHKINRVGIAKNKGY